MRPRRDQGSLSSLARLAVRDAVAAVRRPSCSKGWRMGGSVRRGQAESLAADPALTAAAGSPNALAFATSLVVMETAPAVVLYGTAFAAIVQSGGRNPAEYHSSDADRRICLNAVLALARSAEHAIRPAHDLSCTRRAEPPGLLADTSLGRAAATASRCDFSSGADSRVTVISARLKRRAALSLPLLGHIGMASRIDAGAFVRLTSARASPGAIRQLSRWPSVTLSDGVSTVTSPATTI